ncbi:hypothetical protein StoSoilB22_19230 [Arthrobacter sp. StoSoilB22]|nr:hypothetical protein StoSoilB22_19230 [Arthrobacter sp. StoSoilB22]
MQMAQRGTQEPTLVAGYKEWVRHGRTVLRGEHALWVIAPRTVSMQELILADGQRKLLPANQTAPADAGSRGKKTWSLVGEHRGESELGQRPRTERVIERSRDSWAMSIADVRRERPVD